MNDRLCNIVFIGMPGSGKTTISRQVAQALGRPWFDSDLEIETSEGMGIPEIFAQKGESYFRQKETECLECLLHRQGVVIAAGGGAVLKNTQLIAENATVIYLHRDVESIMSTLRPGTRPLLADPNRLYALYEQRHALYEQLCDYMIVNDTIADTVEKVLEVCT